MKTAGLSACKESGKCRGAHGECSAVGIPTGPGQHKARREPPASREPSRKTGRLSRALTGKEA